MLDAKTYLTLSTFKQHPQQHDIDLFIFHNNIYVWNHKVNKNKGQNVGLACLKLFRYVSTQYMYPNIIKTLLFSYVK